MTGWQLAALVAYVTFCVMLMTLAISVVR